MPAAISLKCGLYQKTNARNKKTAGRKSLLSMLKVLFSVQNTENITINVVMIAAIKTKARLIKQYNC
jgi:hypothetical protein